VRYSTASSTGRTVRVVAVAVVVAHTVAVAVAAVVGTTDQVKPDRVVRGGVVFTYPAPPPAT
jgi:hypothetical protein